MIIFDRFLCCISLKTFGKFLGWTGAMISSVIGYALFLIGSARSAHSSEFIDSYFGRKVTEKDITIAFATLAAVAVIHILLICGIKFGKRLCILPYVVLPIIVAAIVLCLGPSLMKPWEDQEKEPIVIAIYVVVIIFTIYLTLCIYSLYEIVKAEEKRKKFYTHRGGIRT